MRQWVVVANQAEVNVFQRSIRGRERLIPVKTLSNPEARLPKREITRHQTGMGMTRGGRGSGALRYQMSPKTFPREAAANAFAKKTAEFLKTKYAAKEFDQLFFFADPHFLGKVRPLIEERLDEVFFESKDLVKLPQAKLLKTVMAKISEVPVLD